MARLFSCCSSAFFAVFVTLFVLGFLVIGVPGMADEPIPPPIGGGCYNPNDGACANGNANCGAACCPCTSIYIRAANVRTRNVKSASHLRLEAPAGSRRAPPGSIRRRLLAFQAARCTSGVLGSGPCNDA